MYYAEEKIQIACVTWFKRFYPKYSRLLAHIPNGGARSKAEGAIFKSMGVQAGFPDLFLCIARNGYHGLFIEMKKGKTAKSGKGSQRDSQEEYQSLVEEQGFLYKLCYSKEEFQSIIEDYLGPSTIDQEDRELLNRMINS